MEYVPYGALDGRPNIVVDGRSNARTARILSHWPASGTPAALKADTSAEIAMKYLGQPAFQVDAPAVTNNHFDEDGLVGIFALLNPDRALAGRERYVDVASAGDFGVFRA